MVQGTDDSWIRRKIKLKLGLKNKKVLITGGTSGIGFETLKGFLKEGSEVISINKDYNNIDKVKKTIDSLFPNQRCSFFVCDCTNYSDILKIYDDIYKNFGDIDILINNIGNGSGNNEPLPQQIDWKTLWDVNFNSAQYITSVFIKSLLNTKGNIVFVGSIVSKETLNAPTPYTVAKSALLSFSKSLATKYGDRVRVNTVSPGNILIPNGSWDKKLKLNKNVIMRYISDNVPMKRFGLSEEIANAILFLSSDKASFINGANLVVDGGQSKGIF